MDFLISHEKRDLAQIVVDSRSEPPTDQIRPANFVAALLISGVCESGDFRSCPFMAIAHVQKVGAREWLGF